MSVDNKCSMLVITGPTACGKTHRAVEVAKYFNGEILSADSRQIYRGMDIGTGKDLQEYGNVRAHMLDIVPAGYKYNLYEYLRDFRQVCDGVRRRGKLPVVCGGTGLYVESVLNGIALPEVPENKKLRESLRGRTLSELTEILSQMKRLHNTTDVDSAQRAIRAIEIQTYYCEHPELEQTTKPAPVKDAVIVGIDIPREARRSRISGRLRHRLEQENMVDEVKRLLADGVQAENLIYYGLEYKYLTLYVTGVLSYDEMYERLETAIHQFAKRQMTWFRGMERRGFHINWLNWDMPDDEFINAVAELMP
ncbi:MAG: tRNA (adenosine(37)-N6)-dimethylallyltransferase MiaA [Muribaculum sp.]|nr:tRNA (adenosine(37)-N6)-dimethylallyltransferase MiaA [Muribaculaceae bacterium]MCM1081580.1 tRNA (adenosine(37)-N6)-dimethylallyltransferase MiaA [Muribaculum sp.]